MRREFGDLLNLDEADHETGIGQYGGELALMIDSGGKRASNGIVSTQDSLPSTVKAARRC